MGAILGCLTRKKSADAKAAPQNPPVPSIDEVDFMAVHAIVFDNICHSVVWREEEALARLPEAIERRTSTDDESQDLLDTVALQLQFIDDGMLYNEELTLGKLADLVWDERAQDFVNSTGGVYRLLFEMTAAQYFMRNRKA